MQSQSQSGASTPDNRFTAQAPSAEDILKEQTIGLVHLSDFRKRRADALEQSGQDSSDSDGRKLKAKPAVFKKRRKPAAGALSFGDAELEEDEPALPNTAKGSKNEHDGIQVKAANADQHDDTTTDEPSISIKKRLKPNSNVNFVPKSHSKTAQAREAQLKQALQKEYALQQEIVKATEFILPFVFYDGKDTPGGKVRMKKGDPIWLFLERARKVGAESAGTANGTRKDWARISVDDLMIVRQDLILPPHLDFHYFIRNRSIGYHGPLFTLSSEPTTTSSAPVTPRSDSPAPSALHPADRSATQTPNNALSSSVPDHNLEGYSDNAVSTKVVDRRWFERHKHIYPASTWEEFDVERDYTQGGRRDREGNQMFFSR